MARFVFFVVLLLPVALRAQFTYVFDQTIPVTNIDGTELTMPWGGGLNATQYNTMDLNSDGKDDLVLFDRMANKVITIVNDDGQYHYAPEYEILFPEGINNWLLLRDYNSDGKKDIFTGDVLGIKVYQNISTTAGAIAWKPFLFYTGFAGFKSPVLLSKGFSGKINVQLQFDDLPSIIDVDGDGDLDLFNFRFIGNGTVEFHKNFSKERYGISDSLDFERITQTWGNFTECGCGTIALNGEDCPTSGRTKHAGGKSLLIMDADNDNDLDLIMSEAECTRLHQLVNEGTNDNPVFNHYFAFPGSRPVSINVYPAAYNEDVDGDGLKDLMFSTNAFTKSDLSVDLQNSNLFYKNTGASYAYTFTQPDFLQQNMIDVGDNAVPAFADYDGDGDYDMFISRNSDPQMFKSTVYLYENTGTEESPAFKLTTLDYLFFSYSEFYNVKIQFVDVDANNTLDLAFTGTNLFTGRTNLYLLLNRSSSVFDFFGQSYVTVDFQVSSSDNVHFTDVDSDGKVDILVGRGNGELQYWRNAGEPSQFRFTLDNASYLGLTSSVLRQNISTATLDLDADGNDDLVLGDQTGKLSIISDYKNASDVLTASTEIVFNPLIDVYATQNLGGRVWPTIVNLFKTTKPAIVTGNALGGVNILRNDNGESLPDEPNIQVFPNPVYATESAIKVRVDRPAFVQLHSVLGQKLGEPLKLQPLRTHHFPLPTLSSGVYLLSFTIKDEVYTKRFVVAD